MILFCLPLQSVTDVKGVVSIDNATIQGILIAVCLSLGFAVVFLYKNIQNLNKDFIRELKENNKTLIEVNNNIHDSIKSLKDMFNKFYKD